MDSNHQFRESRHRCPHADFSVDAAELVDLVGDWALTFGAAGCDLVRLLKLIGATCRDARRFIGRWRITEMYEWDEIDLAGSAHITFSGKDRGQRAFLAVEADLDVRYGLRDGGACAEFSWGGFDDGTAAGGRGWAALGAPAVWSVTSSSIKVMTQASSPNASDFFNSLLSGSLSPRSPDR